MAVAAKGKKRSAAREKDRNLETVVHMRHKPAQGVQDSTVGASDIRGVLEETFARILHELFPTMRTHDEFGNVDLEIKEQAYVVVLRMLLGTDDYQPRQGLRIREKEISNKAKWCKEHR